MERSSPWGDRRVMFPRAVECINFWQEQYWFSARQKKRINGWENIYMWVEWRIDKNSDLMASFFVKWVESFVASGTEWEDSIKYFIWLSTSLYCLVLCALKWVYNYVPEDSSSCGYRNYLIVLVLKRYSCTCASNCILSTVLSQS